jgi:hypothetical protein
MWLLAIQKPVCIWRLPRHHPRDKPRDGLRLVLPCGAFEGVLPLEGIWPDNLHLPAVVRLGADNRNPPVPRPIREHVLDHRGDFPLHCRVARVLHLY